MSTIKHAMRAKIEQPPPDEVWRQVEFEVMAQVWGTIRSISNEHIEASVWDQVERQVEETR